MRVHSRHDERRRLLELLKSVGLSRQAALEEGYVEQEGTQRSEFEKFMTAHGAYKRSWRESGLCRDSLQMN